VSIPLRKGSVLVGDLDEQEVEDTIHALGLMTVAEYEAIERVRVAPYVLVRNDSAERFVCERCGRKHVYFTSFCVERPWRGLRHALLGYWTNVGAMREKDLTPQQLRRLSEIKSVLDRGRTARTLRDMHPETAQALGTPETDLDCGAWVIGTLEPITTARARYLAARINSQARKPIIVL